MSHKKKNSSIKRHGQLHYHEVRDCPGLFWGEDSHATKLTGVPIPGSLISNLKGKLSSSLQNVTEGNWVWDSGDSLLCFMVLPIY